MEENKFHDDLASIRGLMERSSKFISLSGLSGILAGVYALMGAAAAYFYLYTGDGRLRYDLRYDTLGSLAGPGIIELIVIAMLVLAASLVSGFILTGRKAKKKGQAIWGQTSRALLYQMVVPLAAGGLLILILILRGYYGIVSPASLIFYGLALTGASSFTFTLVKYLGLCEIILGLIAACLPGFGLLFWAIGFGVLHIVYGTVMYLKYDR